MNLSLISIVCYRRVEEQALLLKSLQKNKNKKIVRELLVQHIKLSVDPNLSKVKNELSPKVKSVSKVLLYVICFKKNNNIVKNNKCVATII